MKDGFSRVDQVLAAAAAQQALPVLCYGVVVDGALVHAARAGRDGTVGADAAASAVFRIASVTKSFTAALVLHLRDEGLLRLDDRVASQVPEFRGAVLGDALTDDLTIRDALTMSAGFVTDDPWADRLEGLDEDGFARLLRDGVRAERPAGTRFEYSNLGYALLGRVVSYVCGDGSTAAYRRALRERILDPLGLTGTFADVAEVPEGRLVRGVHRVDGAAPVHTGLEPPGVFTAMGGLFSCVGDLARWIGVLSGAGGTDVLARHSREELQRVHTHVSAHLAFDRETAALVPVSRSYGMGLYVEHSPRLGKVVWHSGGYPGYGSHLRWHAGSRTGVVALANLTYARLAPATSEALEDLVAGGGPSGAPAAVAPTTRVAARAVTALAQRWDDAVVEALCGPNVDLDEPLAARRARAEKAGAEVGLARPAQVVAGSARSASPGHLRWQLAGSGGNVLCEVRVAPTRSTVIQDFTVTALPDGHSGTAAARLVADGRLDALHWSGSAAPGAPARLARQWAALTSGGAAAGRVVPLHPVQVTSTLAIVELEIAGVAWLLRIDLDGTGGVTSAGFEEARLPTRPVTSDDGMRG